MEEEKHPTKEEGTSLVMEISLPDFVKCRKILIYSYAQKGKQEKST